MKTVLTLVGSDGSGKSTTVAALRNVLPYSFVVRNPGTCFRTKMMAYGVSSEMRQIYASYDLILTTQNIYNLEDNFDTVIMDRYNPICGPIYSNNISINGRMLSDLYKDLIDAESIIVPDVVYVLDVSPEVAVNRLADRSGEENVMDANTLEKATNICEQYKNLEYSNNPCLKFIKRIVHIDADQKPEQILEDILEDLRSNRFANNK